MDMMDNKYKVVLIITLVLIFIGAAFQVISILKEHKQGAEIYDNATVEYVSDQVTKAAVLAPPIEIDFKSLKALNADIKGWIWISDSKINYPLLQGKDNQNYLTVTYDGTYNKLGSIFMDYRCLSDFESPNTIMYGHNMLTDEMFGTLEKYADFEFYENHKFIYILMEEKVKKYEIFSAYITDAYGDTYTIVFVDAKAYGDYLTKMKNQSIFDTGVITGEEDEIITLSTCTSSGKKTERFVVQAKQVFE